MASLFLPISASWLGRLRLDLLDAHFEPACRHGELGAQLILVGLISAIESGVRASSRRMVRRTARACTKRNDADDEQARDKETDPDKHDRFDHGTPPQFRQQSCCQNATAGRALPARARVNLNRGRAIADREREWGIEAVRPFSVIALAGADGFQVALGVN